MKMYNIFILLSAIIFLSSTVYAENEPEKDGYVEISPGMELKKIGTVNRLVPIGTKVVDKDGLVTAESMGEYVARRFIETDSRLEAIDSEISHIKETLQTLHQETDQLKEQESGIEAIQSKLKEELAALEQKLEGMKGEKSESKIP